MLNIHHEASCKPVIPHMSNLPAAGGRAKDRKYYQKPKDLFKVPAKFNLWPVPVMSAYEKRKQAEINKKKPPESG